jgi:hypothetical protein
LNVDYERPAGAAANVLSDQKLTVAGADFVPLLKPL